MDQDPGQACVFKYPKADEPPYVVLCPCMRFEP